MSSRIRRSASWGRAIAAMLVVIAAAATGWVCRMELAEALDGWTVRLAEMTLAQYPPGYGEPTPY